MFDTLRLLARACVLAGLLTPSANASAQSALARGVGLRWAQSAGAERCIGSDDLMQKVEQRLGRQVFVRTGGAILVIDGRVEQAPDHGFHALILLSAPDGALYGRRDVDVPDSDCHKLDDVLALIISVTLRRAASGGGGLPDSIASQLDSLLTDSPTELSSRALPEPERSPEPEPEPGIPAAAGGNERTAPSTVRSWRLQLEAGMAVATGVAPSQSFAPLVRLQLQIATIYSVALEGRLGLTREQRIASEPRGALEYRNLAIGLLGCVTPLPAAGLALALCADGRVGSLRVHARDFLASYGASQIWVEVALAASLRIALFGPTYGRLKLGLPWRLLRPHFQYLDSDGNVRDAFTVAPFGLDASLGFGVDF